MRQDVPCDRSKFLLRSPEGYGRKTNRNVGETDANHVTMNYCHEIIFVLTFHLHHGTASAHFTRSVIKYFPTHVHLLPLACDNRLTYIDGNQISCQTLARTTHTHERTTIHILTLWIPQISTRLVQSLYSPSLNCLTNNRHYTITSLSIQFSTHSPSFFSSTLSNIYFTFFWDAYNFCYFIDQTKCFVTTNDKQLYHVLVMAFS